MDRNRAHIISPTSLGAHWQVLGRMAVAFARLIARMEKTSPAGAKRQAEQLEVWLYAALAALAEQIDAPETARDTDAKQRLQAIAVGLITLLLFLQRVKRRLEARMSPCRALAYTAHSVSAPRITQIAHLWGGAREIPYHDTS